MTIAYFFRNFNMVLRTEPFDVIEYWTSSFPKGMMVEFERR